MMTWNWIKFYFKGENFDSRKEAFYFVFRSLNGFGMLCGRGTAVGCLYR